MATTEAELDAEIERRRRAGQQSPSIAQLAAALALAQGEFEAAAKDRQAQVKSDKGNYSYKYANFASIMDAVRAPLAKAKLAVTCRVKTDARGATAVAILMHASGEWMCGDPIFVGVGANTPQATGSAIEYARKYAIRTLLNIATDEEDDDGQAAAGRGNSNGNSQMRPTAPSSADEAARAPRGDGRERGGDGDGGHPRAHRGRAPTRRPERAWWSAS
jgi:hypothetical protein